MKIGIGKRAAWSASAAAIALIAGGPALAQVEQGGATEPQATGVAGASDDNVIYVTAQKRQENLQDVPISISVVGGEDLIQSGSAQITDFAGYVPGLHVDNFGTPGQSRIALRGISPLAASASIGVYVDDAPVGSSTVYTNSAGVTVDLLPYDIARIEVLRGPQGTLYGASTIGGLLKYVTVAPSLDEFSGRVGVEGFALAGAGSLGYSGQAMINAPIVPGQLGITASIAHRSTPGWIDNVQTGARNQNSYDQTGGRLSLLWRPVDPLSVRLFAIYQEVKADNGTVIAETPAGVRVGNGRSNFNYMPEPYESTFQYYGGTVDYDFGPVSLTSVTTYSETERTDFTDASRIFGTLFPLLTGGAIPAGLTPFTVNVAMEKVTQELRLSSGAGGQFEWLLGAFYTHEDATHTQVVNSLDMAGNPIAALDPLATVSLPSTYEEYAVFANATFRATDRFWITGGLRWAHNSQNFRQISAGAIVPAANDPGESSEGVFTYSISPQYHLDDDTMVYARVATGYRPGGPNVILPGVPPTFGPDTVTNYELGLKTRLDRTLSLDVALFRMDWQDIQVAIAFGGTSGLGNGAEARSQGIEAALLWQPVPGLSLGANGAYTDAELTEDAPAVQGLKGDRLARVPKFSGALTANYAFAAGPGLDGHAGAGLRHTGRRFSSVESNPSALSIPGFTAIDLHASVTFDERYTLRAYARNLTNAGGPIGRALVRDGLNQPAYISVIPLQPRTVGLALDVAF